MKDSSIHRSETSNLDLNKADGNLPDDFRLIDEEVLLKKTFDLDPQSGCELLFNKYYSILCSHAIRFVYSREVAQDIVSEIFCKFWSDQTYLTITTSYRAYLFKAVRYSAYNYIKWELSKKNNTIDIENLNQCISTLKPEQAMLYDELSGAIDDIVDSLPHQCKKIFLLNRFENKKYLEIANELKISVKAVEAHITKALKILRKSLKGKDLLVLATILSFLK
jgi:RNA polymerase sigma-70 factor (family 1)